MGMLEDHLLYLPLGPFLEPVHVQLPHERVEGVLMEDLREEALLQLARVEDLEGEVVGGPGDDGVVLRVLEAEVEFYDEVGDSLGQEGLGEELGDHIYYSFLLFQGQNNVL